MGDAGDDERKTSTKKKKKKKKKGKTKTISAEEAAERREYKAEARMNLLSIKKCVELSEARRQNRAFDKKELAQIEEICKQNVEIETYEEWRDRIYAEEDAYRKEQEEEKMRLEKQEEERKLAEKRKKEIEEKHDTNEEDKEEEDDED